MPTTDAAVRLSARGGRTGGARYGVDGGEDGEEDEHSAAGNVDERTIEIVGERAIEHVDESDDGGGGTPSINSGSSNGTSRCNQGSVLVTDAASLGLGEVHAGVVVEGASSLARVELPLALGQLRRTLL